MPSPYLIEPPFVVQVSGGKTSAYMLRRILDAYGGALPEDGLVCFQNTGREREETLDFVREIEQRWGVDIVWLEYCLRDEDQGDGTVIRRPDFRVVDYDTASRDGEPFDVLIQKREFLPNPVARFCTIEMKVKTCERYLLSLGWSEWNSALGIRHDEPRRWMNQKSGSKSKHADNVYPLVSDKVDHDAILSFWNDQPFRLQLMQHEGNCDLCFLKGAGKIAEIVERRPDLAEWWIRQESRPLGAKGAPGRFRSDRPSYASMRASARTQMRLFADDPTISCFCGD